MSAIEFLPEELEADARPAIGADILALHVAQRHGLTVALLKSPLRYKHIVRARVELYRALRDRGWSYPAIGAFVGGRDHTSVLHALASPEKRLARAERAKSRWALKVPA